MERVSNMIESFFVDDVLPHEITEFKKGTERAYHLRGDVAIDRRQIYL